MTTMRMLPLPPEASTWLMSRLIGEAGVESAWVGCWVHGFSAGAAIGGMVGIAVVLVPNLIVLNAVVLRIALRRPGA